LRIKKDVSRQGRRNIGRAREHGGVQNRRSIFNLIQPSDPRNEEEKNQVAQKRKENTVRLRGVWVLIVLGEEGENKGSEKLNSLHPDSQQLKKG